MATAFHSYKRRRDVCSETSIIASQLRSLNDLPEEILLKILSHIGPEDLRLIIAKVCERWNILANDVVLWKTLSYHCDYSSDIRRIKEVLTNAPALHSLFVHDREDAAHILEFLFHKPGDLRKLTLEQCCLGEDGTGLLAKFVDLYPDLEALSLERCNQLTPASYGLIPRLKKLSELHLSYGKVLSGTTLRLIADSCQDLKKLSLYNARQVVDDDIVYVINKLGKQLTALVLSWEGLTDIAFLSLNNCARLQELELSYCYKMTDRGLLEGIGPLHELTSLRLCFAENVTSQAFSMLFQQPSMSSIMSLDLSYCLSLDDEVLKGIAERCIHLKKLKALECSNVTDAGISMVVRHCSQLRVLGLCFINSITGNGWLSLVPSRLPHLRQLDLFRCDNVCYKYVVELEAALPALNIFHGS